MNDATLGDLLRLAEAQISESGSSSARLDAEILAEYAFGFDRTQRLLNRTSVPDSVAVKRFRACVERRTTGEPIAYITGEQEFWSLTFRVSRDTLIPRPDTETLVAAALNHAQSLVKPAILDLGTGSGCILLSLLSELEDARGYGLDISAGAVEIARENATRLALSERATFSQVDVRALKEGDPGPFAMSFDIMVSNPPYIPSGDLSGLMADVRDFEPRGALDGGAEGLDFYSHLTKLAPHLLKREGLLAFEVGAGQADSVAALMKQTGFSAIRTAPDLAGIQRVVSGIWP